MRISRPVAAATLAVTALTGGLGGALLLGPASADPTTSAASSVAPAAPAASAAARCGEGFADIAETIGITTEDLRAALRDDQTLAEIAEANGADPQEVVDVLVANGTARLQALVDAGRIEQATADERVAGLPERATDLVNGDLERPGRRHPRAVAGLRTAADVIGITVQELGTALRDGQTIAQVAEANGVDPQEVIDALVARSTERITKVVNGDTARQRC
jgi:uncharacterized protein YidB (DUF937 family)